MCTLLLLHGIPVVCALACCTTRSLSEVRLVSWIMICTAALGTSIAFGTYCMTSCMPLPQVAIMCGPYFLNAQQVLLYLLHCCIAVETLHNMLQRPFEAELVSFTCLQGQDAMASSHQHFAHPSSPTHHPSPSRMAAASYPHPPPSPPPHPAASYPHPPLSPPPHPAAYTAGHPPAAYVPGSFVAGVPFDSLPLHHQNFILKTATHCWKDQYTDLQQDNYRLKTATHCWKDQYADLQQDNARLRAHIASGEERRESLEDRVQLLEMRLHMQEGGNSRTASG